MSEPSSLVVQLWLNEEELRRYFACPVPSSARYSDWQLLSPEFSQEWCADVDARQSATVESWLGPPGRFRWSHDPVRSRFTYVSPEFSENQRDFLDALTLFRLAADFQTSPRTSLVLIYPHYWAPDVVFAAMEIGPGFSRLLDPNCDQFLIRELKQEADGLLRWETGA